MTEVRYVGANDVEENYQVVKPGDVVDHPDPDRVRALVDGGLWELANPKAKLPEPTVEPAEAAEEPEPEKTPKKKSG